jgi:hypothetical protein
MPDETFLDELAKGFGDAVKDIREKLVEEPMWGRSLSGPEAAPQWPEAQEPQPSFGSSTHIREMEPEPAQSMEQEPERNAPEQDIDR